MSCVKMKWVKSSPYKGLRIDTVIRNQPWNVDLPKDPHHLERKRGRQARVNNWQETYNAIKEYLA